MATTNGAFWNTRVPTPRGERVESFVLSQSSLTLGAAADILRICKLESSRIQIADCFIRCSDMDTNGSPTLVFTLRVTDGTTTKVLIHQSTVGQAGGVIRPTKVPATEPGVGFVTTNGDFRVELLIDTGAATAAAGTLEVGLTLNGWYPSGSVTE